MVYISSILVAAVGLVSAAPLKRGEENRSFIFDQYISDFTPYPSLYQSIFSYSSKSFYVTSSTKTDSHFIQVDPETLQPTKAIVPTASNGTDDVLYGVFGIGIDDAKGHVWVSNTRKSTAAIYDLNLNLVHQYPENILKGSRDVTVDQKSGDVYVTSAASDIIDVFNADKPDGPSKTLNLTELSGQPFNGIISTVQDKETRVIYTVSLQDAAAAAIDVANGDKVTVYPLGDKVKSASGVAYDFYRKHLYVASQASNNTVVVDTKSGDILADIPTGAGGLNGVYDPHYDLVYIADNSGQKVVVIDATNFKIVDTVQFFGSPNHLTLYGHDVYVAVRPTKGKTGLHDSFVKLSAKQNATVSA